MPYTTFVRKPSNQFEVREATESLLERHGGKHIDSYYIAMDIQLSENEFFDLLDDMTSDREWIREFSNWLYPVKDGAFPSIRVSCKGSLIVLIIDPQGFNYPRYVGFEIEEE